jgi:hypothetical protein
MSRFSGKRISVLGFPVWFRRRWVNLPWFKLFIGIASIWERLRKSRRRLDGATVSSVS